MKHLKGEICDVCFCNCYYCNGRKKEHNGGAGICVFGHASYCITREPIGAYEGKHLKVSVSAEK